MTLQVEETHTTFRDRSLIELGLEVMELGSVEPELSKHLSHELFNLCLVHLPPPGNFLKGLPNSCQDAAGVVEAPSSRAAKMRTALLLDKFAAHVCTSC